MANALPILLLGGAAALMLATKGRSKDKKNGSPDLPDGPNNNGSGSNSSSDEMNYVKIAFDGNPEYYYLGAEAVRRRVSGVDSEGFVYPLNDETLGTWLTRVSYWGAHPYPAPYEIPPQCMAPELAEKLGKPCDPGFLPYRDMLLRIYGLVVAEGKKRGVDLTRKAKTVYTFS